MGKKDPFSASVAGKFHELRYEFRSEASGISHLPFSSYAAEPFSALCKCMNKARHALFRQMRSVRDKKDEGIAGRFIDCAASENLRIFFDQITDRASD